MKYAVGISGGSVHVVSCFEDRYASGIVLWIVMWEGVKGASFGFQHILGRSMKDPALKRFDEIMRYHKHVVDRSWLLYGVNK